MIPRPNRRQLLATLAVLVLAGATMVPLPDARGAGPTSSGGQVADGRVVVLGFDGADARTTARMIEEGSLPNLAALQRQGTFAPLISTHPAESAAGWAALNTGTNPVKNGVASFFVRSSEGLEGGAIYPTTGHIYVEDVRIEELETPWLLGILVEHGGTKLTVAVGGASFLLFLLVFKLLLRAHLLVSLALSLVLGVAGGYAAARAAGYVPEEVPQVIHNRVRQPGFWDVAAEGGKRAVVLSAALAFGRPSVPGARVLGGLGLPDIRGAFNGNWFVYTTDDMELHVPGGKDIKGSGSGSRFRVYERDGRVQTEVYGPVDFVERDRHLRAIRAIDEELQPGLGWKASGKLREQRDEHKQALLEVGVTVDRGDRTSRDKEHLHRAKLPMQIVRKGERLAITIAGQTHEAGAGEWTDWFRLPFELNPLITVHGITRARVVELEPERLTIYLHTFDIDPENPSFWQPVSQPAGFSRELVDWLGDLYETVGWSCMTNELKDKALPVDMFLEDVEFTHEWRKRLTLTALERDDWDVLFSVLSTTDRVQHMMYKYHDPLHPLHDPQEAAREVVFFGESTALADVIPAIYRQMDAVVGEVVARLEPGDTLLLCADHGFTSFRRGVDVNNWLVEQGYMVLKPGISRSKGNIGFDVDWSQTRAYSLGLGMIYLNLQGREPEGTVSAADAPVLLREIGEALLELRDAGPEDAPYDEPRPAVRDYAIMDQLYQGPGSWGARDWPCADLQIGFEEYYRVSWDTALGGIRHVRRDGEYVLGPLFRNNRMNWSGDHASNSPAIVTGIFFSNRPIDLPAGGVNVMHLAPTVLAALGVPIPDNLDLPPLTFR